MASIPYPVRQVDRACPDRGDYRHGQHRQRRVVPLLAQVLREPTADRSDERRTATTAAPRGGVGAGSLQRQPGDRSLAARDAEQERRPVAARLCLHVAARRDRQAPPQRSGGVGRLPAPARRQRHGEGRGQLAGSPGELVQEGHGPSSAGGSTEAAAGEGFRGSTGRDAPRRSDAIGRWNHSGRDGRYQRAGDGRTEIVAAESCRRAGCRRARDPPHPCRRYRRRWHPILDRL